MKKIKLPHLLLIMFMVTVWGGNSTAMRIIVGAGMGPVTAAALRFFISLWIVCAVARHQGIKLIPTRREVKLGLPFVGFTLVQIFLFNTASKYTTAGRVGVLVNMSPLWVLLVSGYIFQHDRMTLRRLLGGLMALAGVFAVFGDRLVGGGGSLAGDVMSVFSSLFLAALILYQKWLLEKGLHPMRTLTLQMGGIVPCFFVIAAIIEGPDGYVMARPAILGLLYQGIIVGGGAFVVFQYMQRIYQPSQIASFFFLIPVVSVIAGAVVLGEAITTGLIIGLVLVAAGIYVINRR